MTIGKRLKPTIASEAPKPAGAAQSKRPALHMPDPAAPVAPPKPAVLQPPSGEVKPIKQPKLVELPDSLQRNVVLDTKQFAKLIGYSVPHLRRLYRTGVVPAPIQINGRKMGWSVGVAQDFIAARQTAA